MNNYCRNENQFLTVTDKSGKIKKEPSTDDSLI